MANSKVKIINGVPRLLINDDPVASCAYTTYFDERNRYEDFVKSGYKLFSVTVAFASRSLNAFTGFTPYERGVFDNEDAPDFSIIDDAVQKVLKVCPDAYIFPRLLMTMPEWWCNKHPKEKILTPVEKCVNYYSLSSSEKTEAKC